MRMNVDVLPPVTNKLDVVTLASPKYFLGESKVVVVMIETGRKTKEGKPYRVPYRMGVRVEFGFDCHVFIKFGKTAKKAKVNAFGDEFFPVSPDTYKVHGYQNGVNAKTVVMERGVAEAEFARQFPDLYPLAIDGMVRAFEAEEEKKAA